MFRDQLKRPHSQAADGLRWHAVWTGAFCGLGIAILAAVVFVCLFWVAQNDAFSGRGQTIFEGYMFLIASYLLTVVAFAMLKFKDYEKKLEKKLMAAANVRPPPSQHCYVSSSAGHGQQHLPVKQRLCSLRAVAQACMSLSDGAFAMHRGCHFVKFGPQA